MTIRVDARKDLGVTHTAVDGKKYGFGAAHVAATYADDLQDISHNEEFHRQWRVLAEFPADTGQAASARQSLVNRYGPDGSVLGFTFKTVTSLDKKSRAVLVLFDPTVIVAGRLAEWKNHNADTVVAAAADTGDA